MAQLSYLGGLGVGSIGSCTAPPLSGDNKGNYLRNVGLRSQGTQFKVIQGRGRRQAVLVSVLLPCRRGVSSQPWMPPEGR